MRVTKRVEFAAAHRLEDWPWSKCYNLHGHNWTLDVTVEGTPLPTGEIVDYARLKEVLGRSILREWDHQYLNDVESLKNPTSEVLVEIAYEKIKRELVSLSPKHTLTLTNVRLYETNSCWVDFP